MNETHWVAVGLLAFLGILGYYGVFRSMGAALDKRGKQISDELAEAARLRQEAESVLADYKRRQAEAEKEAAAIVDAAKADAERYAAEAKQKMDDFVVRRTRQAEQKIKMAEEQAMADVRSAAADAAVAAAGSLLAGAAKGKGGDALIADGIKQVRTGLN